MKYLVWIIFLITVQNIFPSGNIYEDALNHFIEHTINDQERGRLNIGKDSIYKHMLIFESNDVIEENIPNVVSGYEIRKIRYIKDYLDTTLIEPITSIVNKCSQMPVQLMQDVPNILEEKYWKPLQKEYLKTIKKHK